MSIDFLHQLNERQYEACTSPAQHLRIIAGAGTGKTRVLTYRIAFLITEAGLRPSRIVAITFTKKVSNEMKERVIKILQDVNYPTDHLPWISTFHSLCAMILRREMSNVPGFTSNFSIYDADDQKSVFKRVFDEMGIGKDKNKTSTIPEKISRLKGLAKFPEDVTESDVGFNSFFTFQELVTAYTKYQNALRSSNAMDFDDLQLFTYRLLKESPEVRQRWQNHFDAYLVDEFQDTDKLQYNLIRLLLGPSARLTVVGDPDQTIYSWRGADSKIMTDALENDFKDLSTVTLDTNYRSTQRILDKANMLIKNNSGRKLDKSLKAFDGKEGDDVKCDFYPSDDFEASMIANKILKLHQKGTRFGDIAIIYRSNFLSGRIERSLSMNRIPYDIYGGIKFYDRKEVKNALSWLKLAVNPKDDYSFLRTITAPSIGMGDSSLAVLKAFADQNGLSLFEAVRDRLSEIGLKRSVVDRLAQNNLSFAKLEKTASNFETGLELSNAVQAFFEEVGFIDSVKKEDEKEDKESVDFNDKNARLNNVKELIGLIHSFIDSDHFDADGNKIEPNLEEFLIDVAIQDAQENMKDTDRVTLMTAHVSKGLEFPVVFVPDMCEQFFPTNHAVMAGTVSAIQEERRLFYVAITRAKKELFISCHGGMYFGSGSDLVPSRFLKEVGFAPTETFASLSQPYGGRSNNFYGKRTGYSRDRFVTKTARTYKSDVIPAPSAPSASIEEKVNQFFANRRPKPTVKTTVTYEVGEKVAHATFGVGVITAVGDSTITVQFNDPYGSKTLAKGHRSYRKVSE